MPESFKKLKIWEKAYTLVLKVYAMTEKFPQSEKFSLIDQLKRSANGVAANIAESQGRYSFKDKIRILYQSRGELLEVRSHLTVSEGLRYISKDEFALLDKEYEGLLIGLNKYIDYLAQKSHPQLT